MAGNLADLHMEDGKLVKITMKRDRLSGKVLSVTEDAIEIEGYGEIPLAPNFHVYKVYGDFKVLNASDILVGYNLPGICGSRRKAVRGSFRKGI